MKDMHILKRFIFWSGPAGIIGGLALATAYVLHPTSAPPEMVASSYWIWIHALFMISLLSGIYLLIALGAHYFAHDPKWRGILGLAVAITSMVLVMALDYAELFIFPVIATEFPAVIEKYGDGVSMPSLSFVFPATGMLFLLGYELFGYEMYRTGSIDQRAALFLMASAGVFVAGLSGFLPMIVVKVGAVLFGLALIWVSYSLMHRLSQVEQPAEV